MMADYVWHIVGREEEKDKRYFPHYSPLS